MWEDVIVDEILKTYLVTSSYREYEIRKIHGRLEIPSYFHISFIKKKDWPFSSLRIHETS